MSVTKIMGLVFAKLNPALKPEYVFILLLIIFSLGIFIRIIKPKILIIEIDIYSNIIKNVNSTIIFDFDHIEIKSFQAKDCLLYTSPSPRDATLSRMPSSA